MNPETKNQGNTENKDEVNSKQISKENEAVSDHNQEHHEHHEHHEHKSNLKKERTNEKTTHKLHFPDEIPEEVKSEEKSLGNSPPNQPIPSRALSKKNTLSKARGADSSQKHQKSYVRVDSKIDGQSMISYQDGEELEASFISQSQGDAEEDEVSQLDNEIEVKESEENKKNTQPDSTKPTCKSKVKYVLEHWITTIIFSVITLWVLFADDIKILTTDVSADPTFSILNIVFMVAFAVELIISSIVIDNYFLGFFFWLDLISTFSMILDIHWIYADVDSRVKAATNITKVGRGARVGSRAVKVLRILRILRLVRIAKLYKASTKIGEKEKSSQIKVAEETKVGKKLTDRTTRSVIIIILSLIIGTIVFDSELYYTPFSSQDFGMKVFDEVKNLTDPSFPLLFDLFKAEFTEDRTDQPLRYIEISNFAEGDVEIEFNLRSDEKIVVETGCPYITLTNETARCYSVFDNRSQNDFSAIINIIKTIFICLVLIVASIFFSKDTTEKVLEPIESMINKIEKISKNPITAMEENEKEDYLRSLHESKNQATCCGNKKTQAPLETMVLEKTITKIGALMALGFGEAGSKIIISNMANSEDSINPMIKGKKVMAIYGFCDIRNFTDTTEVLEEQVMIFVNEIAEIVHGITVDHGGSANKNIGDAFLLVWKFEEDMCEYDKNNNLIGLKQCKAVNEIVDSSVIAFLKVLSKVHKSFKLDKYRKNAGLNKRIKNYSVKMGFGLHLGWSIEGAIGSTFKIDASYLSPHVNVSGKLEEKTKEYGALMIISEDLVGYMTERAKEALRIIDRVKLIEDRMMNIYTVDIDLQSLKIEETNALEELENDKMYKFQKRYERQEILARMMEGATDMWLDYEDNDEDWAIMRNKYPFEFFERYRLGFANYISGDWHQAKTDLEEAQRILGESDRPSTRILGIMNKYNYERPEDYEGEEDD